MSFDIKGAGGYGSGALGDVTDPDGVLNSCLLVSSFNANLITFDLASLRTGLKTFSSADDFIGEEFLIHAFAATGGATAQLGFWCVVKIVDVSILSTSTVFTLDKSLAGLSSSAYHWQAVWLPHFNNLTLTAKNLSPFKPVVNDQTVQPGGVVAFKCSGTFTMSGGHIDLADCGLPVDTASTYRPSMSQEGHVLDTQLYAGAENSITRDHFALNCGDGAAFIFAKTITTQSASRIGNPATKGVQYCRGSSDSKAAHTGSNVGGSTLLIACDHWNYFNAANISKYRTQDGGRGLARAYIAKSRLIATMLADDGLYTLDVIKDVKRLKECGINDYGNGQNGASTNGTGVIVQAKIHSISADKKSIRLYKTTGGGKLLLIHQFQKSAGADPDSGKFFLTRGVESSTTDKTYYTTTLEDAIPFDVDFNKYNYQVLQLYEYTNLTINKEITSGKAWDSSTDRGLSGGIAGFVCSGTLDLRGGKINVEGKGTLSGISNPLVGNAFMSNRLYIGQGHGTVFILAKNIIMDSSTRIGALYDGAGFGGAAKLASGYTAQGGYRGADGTFVTDGGKTTDSPGGGGWGGGAGTNSYGYHGGFFGNAPNWNDYVTDSSSVLYRSYQGAHILIIADTITGLNLSALSTGGKFGGQAAKSTDDSYVGQSGGCGYGGAGAGNYNSISGNIGKNFGGAGGYRGGGAGTPDSSPAHESATGPHHFYGGGAAGACFVYCNSAVNQSTSGIITD